MNTQTTQSTQKTGSIFISTIFGKETGQPIVVIEVPSQNFTLQLLADDATRVGENLIKCAEMAKMDAFLVTFFRDNLEVNDGAISEVLNLFRQWRENYDGVPGIESIENQPESN